MRAGIRSLAFVAVVLAAASQAVHVPASAGEIIDASGRTVKVAEPVARIVAAGPPAEILLYALAPDAMVGLLGPLSPQKAPFMLPQIKGLPVIGGLTAQGEAPEIPEILATKPQLFIDYGDVDPRYTALAAKTQERTGIPYVLLDGAYAKTPDTLRALGKLTGRTARGEELAAYAAGMLARAQKIAAAHAGKPVTAYIARSADGTDTTAPGFHSGDIYDLAGLKNVANDRSANSVQVQGWDPDVIIALDARFAETAKGAAWAGIRAVKTGRVIMVPRLPWGLTDHPPSVNRLIGALWLTSQVYGQPTAAEMKDETARFYKMFFHVDLSPAQVAAMLGSK